ncbi:MAG TPA: serine hydrolase domain-containing protein [Candidatus Limnocylindrales bacterium]|nr:serine hydrolase domain-containing protein [Candidatus Limnocylindrales bacterium]
MPAATHAERRRALTPAFDLARRQVEEGSAPFVILGVADREGVIRLEAVGEPAGANAGRIATDTICLLASITKPIVATAVLQQVEAGAITLAGHLGSWAPEIVNPAWAPVTPWHVLTHTSGLDDVDLEDLIRGGAGRPELLRRIASVGQSTPPGTRYHYASTPFDLLAEAVARRTGEPFETTLRRTLLEPLGMHDTTFDPRVDRTQAARMASVAVGGSEGHEMREDPELVDGYTGLHLHGGGLWSTAPDLLRFGRAMLRGGEVDGVRVLSPASVELMTREVTAAAGVTWDALGRQPDPLASDHYALGWGKPRVDTIGSPGAFGHGGVSGTRLWIDPAYDLVYIYLSGRWGLPLEPIDAVAATIYAALSSRGRTSV